MSPDPLTVAWGLIALSAASGAARHAHRWRRQRAFLRSPDHTPLSAEERAEVEGWARDEGFRCLLKMWLVVGALAFAAARMFATGEAAPIILRSIGVIGFAVVVGILTHWTRAVDRARQRRHGLGGETDERPA